MRVKALTQWYSQPLSVHSKDQTDWLFAPGYLTLKLKRLGQYSLGIIYQGEIIAGLEDAAALNIDVGLKIWSRAVIMHLDQQPCVIGRSIATLQDMQNTWLPLTNYGNTAIGGYLYSDASIKRTPFECAQLEPGDPLDIIARNYDALSPTLNARRSRFIKDGATLLVSECFLNDFWEILN